MVNAEMITIWSIFGALALYIGSKVYKGQNSERRYNNMKNTATEVGKVASDIVKSISPPQGSGTFTSSSKGGSKRKTKRRK
jgi:hypothetical protein